MKVSFQNDSVRLDAENAYDRDFLLSLAFTEGHRVGMVSSGANGILNPAYITIGKLRMKDESGNIAGDMYGVETHQTLEDLLAPMITECDSKDEVKTLLQIYARLCMANNTTAQNIVAIHTCLLNHTFHHLWTKAVGQEQYIKSEWESFRTQLMKTTGIAL